MRFKEAMKKYDREIDSLLYDMFGERHIWIKPVMSKEEKKQLNKESRMDAKFDADVTICDTQNGKHYKNDRLKTLIVNGRLA